MSELWPDLSEEEQVRQREYLERRCQGGILLIRRLGRMYAAALNSRASPLRWPLLEQRRQLLFWRKQSGSFTMVRRTPTLSSHFQIQTCDLRRLHAVTPPRTPPALHTAMPSLNDEPVVGVVGHAQANKKARCLLGSEFSQRNSQSQLKRQERIACELWWRSRLTGNPTFSQFGEEHLPKDHAGAG